MQNSDVDNSRRVIKLFSDIWELTSPLLNTLLQGESIHQTPCLLSFIVRYRYILDCQKYFMLQQEKLLVTAETRCPPTVKELVPGGIEEQQSLSVPARGG